MIWTADEFHAERARHIQELRETPTSTEVLAKAVAYNFPNIDSPMVNNEWAAEIELDLEEAGWFLRRGDAQ